MEIDDPQIDEQIKNPNPSSNPSSSSSSGSDSDEESSVEARIQALGSQLHENPWNYDAHLQYIRSLRKVGDIDKLRKAREAMRECYPLSAEIWLDWTKDEALLNTSSEAFTEIEKLYEYGVREYLSVPLWCSYLNFAQEHDPLVSQCAPAGVVKMRNLFERALTAAGLHVVEGSKIWEAYREYEQALYFTIGDDDSNEEKPKQVQRVRALFHRQLSVPLDDLKSTLASYKLWEVEQGNPCDMNLELDGIPANVVTAYKKALELYNARRIYEDQLSKSDPSDTDILQAFLSYLNFEEASGDPARVQILYERAVAKLPLVSELWLKYTRYLDNTLKVPDVIKDVYARSVRNCSWVGELWANYLLSLERLGAPEKELSSVFERSIQCVLQTFEEYLNLFLTRVDGLRRRISFNGAKDDGLKYTLLRDTFQQAVEYFSPEMIKADDLLHLHAYWARLELALGEDIGAARGVWERLTKISGSIFEVWQGYIAMEIQLGHINEARSIYKRCYSKRLSGMGSEEICHSWLRFEREYGTISDFDFAMKKVKPRLQELEMFKAQQEAKSVPSFSAMESNSVATNVPQKRKMTKATSDKQPPSKRQKDATPKAVEVSYTNSAEDPQNMQKTQLVDKVEQITLPTASETEASTGPSIRDAKSKESKTNLYTDQCTAYISNISFEAKEEHLREFFSDCGGMTAIRLPRDKFTGKPRGIAYVDFSDEEHLAAAVAMNKRRLLGQKISIARSDPKQGHKRASADSTSSRGHGRGAPTRNDHRGSLKNYKSGASEKNDGDVKLVGRNTFAAPRAVRPLGWINKEAKAADSSEQPKSNDEFRAMLLKK